MKSGEAARTDVTTDALPARLDRAAMATGFREAVVPWLVSRAISVVALLVALPAVRGVSRFTQLVHLYDAGFHFAIATDGYGSTEVFQPRWAFFPGVAAVIKAVSEAADRDIGVFVVNNVALLLALVGVHVIARRHGTARAARLAVWSLALFPASFVFSLTYPSSLFLLGTVWAFVFVETRHDVLAGLAAAGATIMRPNAIVVAVALGVAVWSLRRALVVCAPPVLVFVAWCLYCLDRTGDALVFLTVKSQWREITAFGLFSAPGRGSAVPHLLLASGAIAVVLVRRAHLPRAWIVFALLYLVPSLVLGLVGLGRYTNECFPVFVAAGQLLATWRPRLAIAALVLSSAGIVVMAAAVAGHGLVP